MALYLKNATFVDWKTMEVNLTDIRVHQGIDGSIEFIDNSEGDSPIETDEVIDCSGKIVTKSFVVGHHHVYSGLAMGMPAPKKTPKDFREILKYIWWTLDKSLDHDTIQASALATAMACAKAGSTFAIDHHVSPNFINGSLQIIADAFDRVGVSHLLAYEITDRDGLNKADQGLVETERYLSRNQGLVGMHASFTIGNDTMQKAAELMRKLDSGFHIHVAEDYYDQLHCEEEHGKRVVERLSDFGVLESSKTILVHGLHLNDNERKLISDSKVWIAENKESNMNNNVGQFNGTGLGSNIMLGTDGMHSDMLQSAKTAFFAGQGVDNIDFMSAYTRFRNAHNYLNSNKFKGDGENNLVILDYDGPTALRTDNFLGHFIFGIKSNHVQHVISNGELIVKDRQMQTVDEQEVLDFTRKQSMRLWDEMKKQ
jgi:cytosine/adenosine deaminase-related metal-dependent hydrolase